jgi:lysophospholipase L1-like esterase
VGAEYDATSEARRLFDQGVPWGRYVAIGDSITEGELGDPYPPYAEKGFPELVADAFQAIRPDFKFFNLGARYQTARDIRRHQLPRALELEPDLVTVWAGGNDLLIENCDIRITEKEVEAIVAALEDSGATVMMGTWPNAFESGVIPQEMVDLLGDTFRALNDAMRAVAARHDVVLLDLNRMEWGADPDFPWLSEDLQHPNRLGHAITAQVLVERLHEHVTSSSGIRRT